ncbi:outer membrane beta-barrel protein [Methylocystis sp. 9N]|uniref:Outer membrane beta-barrel protein n=1 Tax=Methylocystis borbori TaxID=3118750 RepID=A0ABU7XF90_9HYPH
MANKLLTGAVMTLALAAGSALAADFPSHKAPPAYIPPPPTWTGFHVGLNAGGAWSASTTTNFVSTPFLINGAGNVPWAAAAAIAGSGGVSTNAASFIGGGQIGYDWQFSGGLLAGVEADIQGVAAGNNNTALTTLAPTPLTAQGLNLLTSVTSSKALDYLGTVRGRLGYLITPTLLAYATGGLAYGGATSTTSFFQTVPNDLPGFLLLGASQGRYAQTRVGWTVGGGLEWMFWPQWSAKIEYLFYDLGSAAYPVAVTADWQLSDLLAANATQARTRFDGHIVRAGGNYHFNWGDPPIVAKY